MTRLMVLSNLLCDAGNSMPLVSTFIFSLIVACCFIWYLGNLKGSPEAPPSPRSLFIIGNLHQLTSSPIAGFQLLAKKHGPLMLLHFGSLPVYVITSSDMARDITKNHDTDLLNRPKITKASEVLLFGGNELVFSPYEHFFKKAKKLCVAELLSPKMVQSLHYIREEEMGCLMTIIRSSSSTTNSVQVNVSELLEMHALNLMSRAVLGKRCAGVYADGYQKLPDLLKHGADLLDSLCFADIIPMFSWLDTLNGFNTRLRRTFQGLNDVFEDAIISHLETQADHVSERKDFLDVLLDKDTDFTRNNIKGIVMNLLQAGSAMLKKLMEWTMAELARNPTSMKKLQEEVRRVVGKKTSINDADLSQMEFLQCVVKETLRLHGEPIMARQSSTSIKIGGYQIPANATVLIIIRDLNRDVLLWDKPSEFIPERFMENKSLGREVSDHAPLFIPFGFGRRICPAAGFSVTGVEHAIASLLCWFDWELPAGMKPQDLDMSDNFGLVGRMKTPLLLVPKPYASS